MVSSQQRVDVDKRVEFCCVTNSTQDTYRGKVVNVHAAIRLAFVLGARFGLAQPMQAGDFMGQWITDHTLDGTIEELAVRHQRAMLSCVEPLQYTPDQYQDIRNGDE